MASDKKDELFVFSMRMSAIDRNVLEAMSNALEMNSSDIIKCAMYEFALSDKSKLLKQSLKELARLKQMDFKMEVFKEIEHITHKQAYYLDGFMHTLKDYHGKYVPLEVVRRYVTIKIISLFTLYGTGQRKEFNSYLRKHFLHFYPSQKAWVDKQYKYIRSMKKDEKDELLSKLAGHLPQMHEVERGAGRRGHEKAAVLELPAKRAKDEDFKAESKE